MANLSVSISESLNLNGKERGSTNTASVSDITECSNEIKFCPSNKETYLGNFASTVDATKYSNWNYNNAKYVRVTNLNTELAIEVAFASTGVDDICGSSETSDSYRVLLLPGQSSIVWDTKIGKLGASALPTWATAMTNLSYVSVNNTNNSAVDVEFFVASTTPEEEEER